MAHVQLEGLEAELGHRFRDPDLLRRALTHKSLAYEQGLVEVAGNNEQLEFLGDSILGFLASEWLVARFPGESEGRLTKRKAHLVSALHLHHSARSMNLGRHLLLGKGEESSGGREKRTLLSNAVEALIAALYLDGGMDPARQFVEKCVLSVPDGDQEGERELVDFKGALKELATARGVTPPNYIVIEERGPLHAKVFVVEARVGKGVAAHAEGPSKKRASQEAARLALDRLMLDEDQA